MMNESSEEELTDELNELRIKFNDKRTIADICKPFDRCHMGAVELVCRGIHFHDIPKLFDGDGERPGRVCSPLTGDSLRYMPVMAGHRYGSTSQRRRLKSEECSWGEPSPSRIEWSTLAAPVGAEWCVRT